MRNQPCRQAFIDALERRKELGKVNLLPVGLKEMGVVVRTAVEVAWEEGDMDMICALIALGELIHSHFSKESLSSVMKESSLFQKKKLWRRYLARLSGPPEHLPMLLTTARITMESYNCPEHKISRLIDETAAQHNISIEVLPPPAQESSEPSADPLGVL